ncbi:MAG: UDP-N-acetylglucosamine 1-carboxyvinyltransferase [Candidatus Levyibacteriota bacterium]
MEKLVITGGNRLQGEVAVSGSKNVALKALVACCLTDEEVIIENIPHISDFFVMVEIMQSLGATVDIKDHTASVKMPDFSQHEIPLDKAALARTSSMFIAPLLARVGEAIIPNPGGCRLGARPIDRIIEGLRQMKATITYNSEDGYFHAKTNGLEGVSYAFEKNTHTGTETLILAAVTAEGKTVLSNAAEEPEIDELIVLLTSMGADIKRTSSREITIQGVKKLHGTTFRIQPDRNEIVTFAIAAVLTQGDIFIHEAKKDTITSFLEKLTDTGGGFEEKENGMRFYYKGDLRQTDVETKIYPGFMTDWQAPWAVLMTKADGTSTIHETVFENKMGYIADLQKMGAHIVPFKPNVSSPEKVYNFNLSDDKPEYVHAMKITGPVTLHNAIVSMENIRAGAAVVLAALAAKGTSTIFGVEKLDRGYEQFEKRLQQLGAEIRRMEDN